MKRMRMSILLGVLSIAALLAVQREGSGSNASSRKSQEPVLALNGLDPVFLVNGRREKGQGTISATHNGYRYHFATQKQQQAFQSDPGKYAVHPLDPVITTRMGVEAKGKPDLFAVHRGKIFLFTTPDTQRVFQQNPEEFLGTANGRDSRPKPEGSHPEGSHPER